MRRSIAALAGKMSQCIAQLPTQLVSKWQVFENPGALDSVLLYTAPISGYRGRYLAQRLQMLLPEGPTAGLDARQGGAAQQGKQSHQALIQLRYPFSTQARGPGCLLQMYTLDSPAYNKHLLTEDFDTFAADVAARHVELHDKALVTAYLDSLTWFRHTHPHQPCQGCQSSGAALDTGQQQQAGSHRQTDRPACSQCRHVDLFMTGQVSWVGTSSLEVTLELTRDLTDDESATKVHEAGTCRHTEGNCQQRHPNSLVTGPEQRVLVARARFIMAARDKSLQKAMRAPPLSLTNDLEKQLFQEGGHRQKQRHGGRKEEDARPLTPELSKALQQLVGTSTPLQLDHQHDLLGLHQHTFGHRHDAHAPQPQQAQQTTAADDTQAQHMSDEEQQQQQQGSQSDQRCNSHTGHSLRTSVRATTLSQTFLTQYQERNTTGTVFGGQLLLYGLRVGELVATQHVGQECDLLVMRDVPFLALVPLGHLMHVTGKVVATKGPLVVVHVRAAKADPAAGLPAALTHTAPHHASANGSHTQQTTAEGEHSPRHSQHAHLTPTHVYWCVFRAPEGAAVPAVVPHTLHEVRDWAHAMHMLEGVEADLAGLAGVARATGLHV